MDNSYLDLQTCGTSSTSLVQKIEIGVWREAKCPTLIDWFEEGKDFILIERGGDGIQVSREDNSPNGAWKTTKSGEVTAGRSITIKCDSKHKLYQKFMSIQIENQGSNGKVFQIYSDGGFHFRITLEDGSIETLTFSWQELWLNAKIEGFLDTFWQDFANNEDGVELTFLFERDPLYFLEGTLDENFSIPESFAKISIANDVPEITNAGITISNVILTDPDLAAYSSEVRVEVVDETGTTISQGDYDVEVSPQILITESFVPGEYTVKYYYKYNSTQYNLLKMENIILGV